MLRSRISNDLWNYKIYSINDEKNITFSITGEKKILSSVLMKQNCTHYFKSFY